MALAEVYVLRVLSFSLLLPEMTLLQTELLHVERDMKLHSPKHLFSTSQTVSVTYTAFKRCKFNTLVKYVNTTEHM